VSLGNGKARLGQHRRAAARQSSSSTARTRSRSTPATPSGLADN